MHLADTTGGDIKMMMLVRVSPSQDPASCRVLHACVLTRKLLSPASLLRRVLPIFKFISFQYGEGGHLNPIFIRRLRLSCITTSTSLGKKITYIGWALNESVSFVSCHGSERRSLGDEVVMI